MTKKRTFLMVLLCFGVLFAGCSEASKAEKLALYAEEQFMKNDYEEYILNLREKTGLSDLDIEINTNYYYEYDYNKQTNTLYTEGKLIFTSDDIDDYYTTEYNEESSNKLAEVLNNLKNVYYEEPTYTYSFSEGTVHLKISNGVSDEIHVKTNSGRDYALSYYVDYDTVEIDGEWVYHKEARNDFDASSSSGYTGAYDAILKYSGTDGVLICISEDAMERFMTAVNNGNEGTLEDLFLSGQCAYTEQRTKCNILERKLTKCQVKLLDGSYAGNTVWVILEAVQEE